MTKFLKSTSYAFAILILLNSCGAFKPKYVDSRKTPANAAERAKQNVETGKGISLNKALKGRGRGGSYEFSTSNVMWRASLELLDFIPLTTVDYSGGIIITDWYNDKSSKDSIKITIRFLSNEIRADSLKIIVHKKACSGNQNCTVSVVKSKIEEELLVSILRSASTLEQNVNKKK